MPPAKTPVVNRVTWLVELARPKPAPVPWGRALRVAAVLTLPVAVGLVTGHVRVGLDSARSATDRR